MPTIVGMRRRGYTPEGDPRRSASASASPRRENVVDVALLEHSRPRGSEPTRAARDGVLRPLRVVIENYPGRPGRRGRRHQQSRRIRPRARARCRSRACCTSSATTSARIRRRSSSGWRPDARCACAARTSSPAPGSMKDPATGEIAELRCTYDPATRGGDAPGRPQGEGDAALGVGRARDRRRGPALRSAVQCRGTRSVRRLPGRSESRVARDRPRLQGRAVAEAAAPGARFQFERLGYFCVDRDSTPALPVFNRTVTLKDSWARIEARR